MTEGEVGFPVGAAVGSLVGNVVGSFDGAFEGATEDGYGINFTYCVLPIRGSVPVLIPGSLDVIVHVLSIA